MYENKKGHHFKSSFFIGLFQYWVWKAFFPDSLPVAIRCIHSSLILKHAAVQGPRIPQQLRIRQQLSAKAEFELQIP